MVSTQNKSKPRKKIPKATEAQILIQSRRRCCLCHHFHGDIEVKNGQIAHINKKRDDNSQDNLAFLCFHHHDEYDSTRSQSKGITSLEVKHARQSLYDKLSTQINPNPIKITISIEGDFNKLNLEERDALLAKALSAAQVENNVKVHNVEPGSIKFTIELSSDGALQIINAFHQNKLSDIGVKEIAITETASKSNIGFSPVFKELNHGITKREAIDIILNPDSSLNLDDILEDKSKPINIVLYLKKVSYKHSVLMMAYREEKIKAACALPINHNEINFKRGDNPWSVFNAFIKKYGIKLEFDYRHNSIWMRESIHIPFEVNDYEKLKDYLIETTKEAEKGDQEIICFLENKVIISRTVSLDLMFAIKRDKYYSSLRSIGIKLKGKGNSGVIVAETEINDML